MGLDMFVKNPAERLPTVTAVSFPPVSTTSKFAINSSMNSISKSPAASFDQRKNLARGLDGPLQPKGNVLLFLAALEKTLLDQGFRVPSGAA